MQAIHSVLGINTTITEDEFQFDTDTALSFAKNNGVKQFNNYIDTNISIVILYIYDLMDIAETEGKHNNTRTKYIINHAISEANIVEHVLGYIIDNDVDLNIQQLPIKWILLYCNCNLSYFVLRNHLMC